MDECPTKTFTAKAQGTLNAFKTLCAALRSLRLCGENVEALQNFTLSPLER
jgi:hypothetical protein